MGCTSCIDTVLSVEYDSYSDAVAAGEIRRGWMPEWMPKTVYDIRETHDLDTNRSSLFAKVPSIRDKALLENCVRRDFPSRPTFLRSDYERMLVAAQPVTCGEFKGLISHEGEILLWR